MVEVAPIRALLQAVIDGDRSGFRTALLGGGIVPEPARYDFDAGWEMFAWMWAPYRSPRFDVTMEWLREGRRFTGPAYPNQRHQAFPPAWIWLFRVTLGVHTSLARLGVTLDARALAEGALARPMRPLADPCAGLE